MRILMAIDGLGRGGKERRMLELIKGLLQENDPHFEICVITLSGTIEYPEFHSLPIRLEVLDRKHKADFSFLFRMYRIIRTFKPDLVHSWGTLSSLLLAPAKLLHRFPFINGVLADAPSGLDWKDKHYRRVKLTTPFTDVFVSNSKAGILAYRTPARKSVTIYNGVNLARFENLPSPDQVARELIGREKTTEFVVANVANFDERKDQASAIQAAIACCRRKDCFLFVFIGTGPTLEKLQAQVAAAGFANRFIFAGRRSDVEAILQVCDAGVLMTNTAVIAEGVSNAILEYQLSRLPVIASKGGGTDEVIEEGKNGFLIEPGDSAMLEKRLMELEADRALCRSMGGYAYSWCSSRFKSSIQTANYIALYRKMTGHS